MTEDEFLIACLPDCRCCHDCQNRPCAGVTAGGLCDEMCCCTETHYEDEYPDADWEDE